ncbi:MAG: hypothetical protein WC187_09635 [Bacillota bacterium]
MKKIIIGFIVGALMFGIIPVMAEGELSVTPNPFPVVIDGVVAEVEGYNINGYTFLKLADFGKAGLTVKFNETDKQIEISGKEKAIITPEPIPDKGEEPVSDVERFEENGYKGVKANGVEYYYMMSIHDKIYSKGYDFRYNSNTGKWALTYNNDVPAMSIEKVETVLEGVPCKDFGGLPHVEKEFYLNNILPLLK